MTVRDVYSKPFLRISLCLFNLWHRAMLMKTDTSSVIMASARSATSGKIVLIWFVVGTGVLVELATEEMRCVVRDGSSCWK